MRRASGAIVADASAPKSIARVAPYFVLGPVSGPLTAGLVFNFRDGRPVLASMYGFVLTGWLVLAPLALVHLAPVAFGRLI